MKCGQIPPTNCQCRQQKQQPNMLTMMTEPSQSSPSQLQKLNDPKRNLQLASAKIASAKMQTNSRTKNANVIESRNQASVGLTLLSSKVSCLSSPQTPMQCRRLILCFSSHGRLIRPHWTLYYRPIRVPDSFTFGCPAPRLGLTLPRLAACLPATLAFAQLRLCSLRSTAFPFGLK